MTVNRHTTKTVRNKNAKKENRKYVELSISRITVKEKKNEIKNVLCCIWRKI
jgi:hypothetical protein